MLLPNIFQRNKPFKDLIERCYLQETKDKEYLRIFLDKQLKLNTIKSFIKDRAYDSRDDAHKKALHEFIFNMNAEIAKN